MSIFRAHSGTSLPHVLVLGDIVPDDPTSRDWSIEHHPDCPVEHYAGWSWVPWVGLMPYRASHLVCPVQWELDAVGLDGLDWDGQRWQEGGRRSLASSLPAGRYIVTAWWHDGYGMGEYGGQGDGDGTFDLQGPETPLALTYPPNLLNPHVYFQTRRRGRPYIDFRGLR